MHEGFPYTSASHYYHVLLIAFAEYCPESVYEIGYFIAASFLAVYLKLGEVFSDHCSTHSGCIGKVMCENFLKTD